MAGNLELCHLLGTVLESYIYFLFINRRRVIYQSTYFQESVALQAVVKIEMGLSQIYVANFFNENKSAISWIWK